MLAFYRKFWRYSARNLVLIKCQRPGATRVAGYHTWQTLERRRTDLFNTLVFVKRNRF